MKNVIKSTIRAAGRAIMRPGMDLGGRNLSTRYKVVCRDREGRIKWTDYIDNLVVNVGLDDSLDKHLKGSGYTAAWYIGLMDGSPSVAAGDTMASHAGWTEVQDYSEANRQAATFGTVSGQSVDNSGSVASFSIDTNGITVGGAFLVTDNTKGGTTGILYGAGAFDAGDKSLDDGDTLDVTLTATAAAS